MIYYYVNIIITNVDITFGGVRRVSGNNLHQERS